MTDLSNIKDEMPKDEPGKRLTRYGWEALAGLLPGIGGVISAGTSAWSDSDQKRTDDFFVHWLEMLTDDLREKGQTIVEIAERLDLLNEQIDARVNSPEYQSILKKAFRDWAAAESEEKRKYVRNILSNAAATAIVSDDVVKMFLDWLKTYSEFHFQVIAAIHNQNGISRGEIWRRLGKQTVGEASAEADLYKLMFRDLSTGGIIRQHVERDYYGNVVPKPSTPRRPKSSGLKPPVSAFDENEPYELTELGSQFVHYAITDLPLKITAEAATSREL